MVTDIKTIKKRKKKAKIKYGAGFFMLVKCLIKKIVFLFKARRKIRRAGIIIADIYRTNKRMILDLKQIRSGGASKHSHPALLRISAAIMIFCLISAQALLINGFEAHVINITAQIVNDIPDIEPDGGEFCDINGAEITLSTTLVGTSTIIYTTDGSEPVCPSTGNIYTAPFTIYQSSTVKARTCHDGKQSAIASQYFEVSSENCPPSDCNAEPIDYWQINEGCGNVPAESDWAAQIHNLSIGHFQSAFATTTAGEICSFFDLNACPAEGTLAGELCRAKGKILADHSNLVSGRLDLNAVIAGSFDNSQPFIDLSLTASSTIEEALNKIEGVLIDPGAALDDLAGAGYAAERIYEFYSSESPYLPEPKCVYWEPGDIVLNEFVPNPSCAAQPVDVILAMDTSGSMNYDSPTRLSQAKTAANQFIGNLQSNDQSGLVSYATTATLKKQLSNNHASTTEAINALTAIGATNIGDGIATANTELTSVRANPDAAKVEILLTDGLANKPYGPGYGEWPADVAYAKAKADEAAAQGIKIFTIGLGTGVNASMLQYIATTTGANYYFAPSGAELAAIYTQISQELCANAGDDQTGLAGEWVELYNKGTSTKDLADWMIANAATTTPVKINSGNTLASSTIIGAAGSGQEWLVALFNEERLNNEGDTIFLYDNIGHLLDFYSYASSTDDDPDPDPNNTPGEENTLDGDLAGEEGKSFARIPDGTGGWVDPIPTPGGPNRMDENITLDAVEGAVDSNIAQDDDALAVTDDTGEQNQAEQASNSDNANLVNNNTNEGSSIQSEIDNGSLNLNDNAEADQTEQSEQSEAEAVVDSENVATSSESGEIAAHDSAGDSYDNSDNIIQNNSELKEVKPESAPQPEPSQDNNGIEPTDEQAKEPVKLIDTETLLNNQPTIL